LDTAIFDVYGFTIAIVVTDIAFDSKSSASFGTGINVKLKDTYAIDRYNSSLQSCVSQFAEGKLIYTIVDADSLSTIDASGVETFTYSVKAFLICTSSIANAPESSALLPPILTYLPVNV